MRIVLAGATDGEYQNRYGGCEATTADHVLFGERLIGEDADLGAIEMPTAMNRIPALACVPFNLNICLSAITIFH
jgi:hypothetical protein